MTEDKNEASLTRMGAIIGQGIINAAGRNATISLITRDGNLRQNAIVGIMLFMQHWYWYPMMSFLPLAFTPTALIGLNKSLKVPKNFKCISNARPSTYKYPEFIKVDKDRKKEKVTTAVLSTTTKAKARKDRKEGKTVSNNEIDSSSLKKKDVEMSGTASEIGGEKILIEEEKKEIEEEANF